MGQVIKFTREKEDIKGKAIKSIQEAEGELHLFVSFPKDDEGDIFFLSNFEAGVREIAAIETVLSFLTNQHFDVEDVT